MAASDTEFSPSRSLSDWQRVPGHKDVAPDIAVEDLGLGFAQVRTLAFVGVVPFCMGAYMAGLSLAMTPLSAEFRLTDRQETCMTFLMNLGLFFGGLTGGWCADRLGRKVTILFSSCMLVTFGVLLAVSQWLLMMLCSWLALGCAAGFGFGACCALLNETSPRVWRTSMRAATDSLIDVGFIFSASAASMEDGELLSISWRRLLVSVSVPCALLGLLTWWVQIESPIFLAACNRSREAEAEMARLGRLNSAAPLRGKLRIRPEATRPGFFSRGLFNTTATVLYVAFILNLVQCAAMYFRAQVQTQGNHDLIDAWRMLSGGLKEILALLVAAWFTRCLPHAISLQVALIGSAFTVWAYALGAGATDASVLMQLVDQFSTLGFHWAPTMGLMIAFQVSVEVYPTTMAATAAGMVLATGRLAAILVPDLLSRCEALVGSTSSFCCVAGCLCILGAALVRQVFEPTPETMALLTPNLEHKATAADA